MFKYVNILLPNTGLDSKDRVGNNLQITIFGNCIERTDNKIVKYMYIRNITLRTVGKYNISFSPGPLVSSTNRTDRQDITEVLLKVLLNNTTLTPKKILKKTNVPVKLTKSNKI